MLIKHAKWEPMRLSKYDTGCYFETIKDTWWTKSLPLDSDMLKNGVLVPKVFHIVDLYGPQAELLAKSP